MEKLFDTAPPGFVLVTDVLSDAEEASLLTKLVGLRFDPIVLHGRRARRSARHFGLDYDYVRRVPVPGDPLPGWLDGVRNRVASVAGIAPGDLVETLVQHYPPGATIGWHRDAPAFDIVVGVSLRGRCRMRFRRSGVKAGFWETVLEPRAVYLIRDEARHEWQHSIPASQEERYSITFRTLR